MSVSFTPIPAACARALRTGCDAYGLHPEQVAASTGTGAPCRHCLRQVPQGASYLIAAHRPFVGLNPYTETGPIFLCADDCPPGGPDFPAAVLTAPQYIVRGYDADERIIYGTGGVVPTGAITARCAELLTDRGVAFIHIRSASNNCFLCRADRG